MSKGKSLGFLAALVAATLLVSIMAGGPALAARGGKGGSSSATLTVAPNPAPYGTTSIVISGSGFGGGQFLRVGPRGMIPTAFVTTDANGAFSITYPRPEGFISNILVEALKQKGQDFVLAASTTLVVCSTNPCP